MHILVYVLFLALVVGGGSLVGISNTPDGWYAALDKPFFNPPNWIFGPVWTVLYVMIAIGGARIWLREHTRGAMTTWWIQLGLNFLWSPVFFTLQSPGAALVVILALLATLVVFIRKTWNPERVSALLFVPYLAWVAFAALLNASIVYLN